MKKVIFALLAIICFLYVCSAQPGFQTNISMTGVTRLGRKIIPVILSKAVGPLPDMRDGKNRFTNQRINSIGLEDFQLVTNGSDTLTLKIIRFHVNYSLKFKHKGKIISYGANVTAKINKCTITVALQLKNNNGKPALSVGGVSVTAGDASIKISGGLIAKLANLIKSLFKSKIKSAIVGAIKSAITSGLNTFSSTIVGTIPLRVPFGSWGSLNLALSGPVTYKNNSVGVGFSGEIQDSSNKSPSGVARHTINFNPTGHLFGFALDTFVFNSGFATFFQKNLFNRVHAASNPANIPMKSWKTDGWTNWPQLTAKYPKNDMRLQLNLHKAPLVTATGGKLGAEIIASIFIQVNAGGNWVSVCEVRVAFTGAMTVSVSNKSGKYFITPQLQNLTQKSSLIVLQIAQFDLNILDAVTNFVSNSIVIPMINNELINGIQIPTVNGMSITNPKLTVVEHGVSFSTDIDFTV